MAAARFTWELRARIPVLYTHQKNARRRVFREGSVRLAAGLAVLLDGEGRAQDEQTVTVDLLEQFKRGEEIDFPGHLVQPDGPVALGMADAGPGKAAEPVLRSPSPRAQRLRQPFKRPRMATEEPLLPPHPSPPSPPPERPKADPTPMSPPGAGTLRATRDPDLWDSVAMEGAEDMPVQMVDLWEAAEADLQAELRHESHGEDPETPPRSLASQPLPTPCRARVSPTHIPEAGPESSWEQQTLPNLAATALASEQEEQHCSPNTGSGSEQVRWDVMPEPSARECRHDWLQEAPAAVGVSPEFDFQPSARDSLEEPSHVDWEPAVSASPSASAGLPPGAVSDKVGDDVPQFGLAACGPSASAASAILEELPPADDKDPDGLSDADESPGGAEAFAEPDFNDEEEVSEEDLPLLDLVEKARKLPAQPQRARDARPKTQTKTQTKLPSSLRLPLFFDANASPPLLPAGSEYCAYFEHTLLTEMQRRLGQLSAAWKRSAHEGELSLAVKGARMGRAKEDPNAVALILGRSPSVLQGDVKACAKNDLWIILMNQSSPLLLRSAWKGVNPSGRLLCTAVNETAASWLETCNSRLLTVTALASGAFASELLQIEALRCLRSEPAESACQGDLAYARLLGAVPPAPCSPPKVESEPMQEGPELADLSAEQRQVVRHVAAWVHPGSNNVPTLLRGVFGSGKSRTLAACIVSLDRLLRARRDPRRILLLCQTNVAVDTVLHHLLSHFGWDDFARLGSFRSVDPELLYRTVSLLASRPAAAKELSDALQRRPPEVRQALQSAIDHGLLPPKPTAWRRRRLVAATTAALESADLSPEALSCPFVLVDEATQLTEPAIFYALQKARAEQVLLVGDPRQLPPRAAHAPLQLSALERLWDQKIACRLELATQFRCHPCIAGFCSSLFYGGALKSGITAEDRSSGLGPGAAPLAVVLSEGSETRVGLSFRHDAEAQLCSSWLKRASSCGRLQPKDFGVICLYRPHADACGRAVRSSGALKEVEVATVDAFQGGEREAVALCCGRSSRVGASDPFACCPRRLNVALSRARRHLVIFGSECFLSQHPTLSHILAAAAAQGSVHRASDVLA
eukprot:s248_g4.t1